MNRKAMFIGGVALAALVLAGIQPAAAERGKFVGHAVLASTQFAQHAAQDGHPMKSAMSGELDGIIFHNGGGAALDRMLDRAHYHVVWVGDGGGGGYCLKTFTTKDGHKLFARCDSKATPTGSAGTVTLLGGTGPFSGIKGRGKFNFVGVTERVSWDDLEWEWETP
ncbi:MAG: hypothetical protein WDZ63_11090 [Burkholderiales bacterium]